LLDQHLKSLKNVDFHLKVIRKYSSHTSFLHNLALIITSVC
jgi:hypothetical protein